MSKHPLLPDDEPLTAEQAQAAWVGEMPRLTGRVEVTEYDPEWPRLYEREAARLRALLGERVLALEHVGSTAVPGLPAKPIIDLDLSLADSTDEAAYLPILEGAGYRLVLREPDWHEHRMLGGPDTDSNLHVWTLGSPEARRHPIFRDWLRTQGDDRRRYGELKRELAGRDFSYMHEYNNAKAPLIREILARALAAHTAENPGDDAD
ncbi:GrpB family protein [Deinococcus planocerae]|uniref:GrpB family protein n=1 Tax=Deinococcus planocerae TaxID=1737569 RepID=UPI000C7F0709|nr:GrpB family protein [Deinococcus planocerae]